MRSLVTYDPLPLGIDYLDETDRRIWLSYPGKLSADRTAQSRKATEGPNSCSRARPSRRSYRNPDVTRVTPSTDPLGSRPLLDLWANVVRTVKPEKAHVFLPSPAAT